MPAPSEIGEPMAASEGARTRRRRDVRLDFFRGLGMFIIFVAHVPDNTLALVIPARFGVSDATEMFVFCSGMASAIAFGRLYDTAGFALATARIAHRIWQVYWAHVGVFLVALVAVIAADRLLAGDRHLLAASSFQHFLSKDTGTAVLGFMTLTFLPQYFDILPMYLVILAMLPLVMALSRIDVRAAGLAVAATWLIGTMGYLQLPGDPWTGDTWFFHPLAWQLLFFTGFAFMRGWLPAPPVDRHLIWLSAAILVASFPISWWPLVDRSELLTNVRIAIYPLLDKSLFGGLRYIHFLALAYLAYVAAGPGGNRLDGPAVRIVTRVGQQTLAVFMGGIVLAQLSGVVLRAYGHSAATLALVNAAGFAGLVAIAYVAHWFKAAPWGRTHVRASDPVASHSPARPGAGPDRVPAAALEPMASKST
jgi:hypothetical protein